MFRNTFLKSLNAEDRAAFAPHLKEVVLGTGQRLCEAGELPQAVYFSSNAVASVVTLLQDNRAFEVSSVGYESVIGLFPALTGLPTQTQTVVQLAGTGFRLPMAVFRQRLDESSRLMSRVLAYLQISSSPAERSIVCNAVHHLPNRLARWLLVTHDRVDVPVMALTQDYMCVMVGALRSSVSLAASGFKSDGLITYSRGRVTILDRAGLERRACECYRGDMADLGKLLHGTETKA